ncbi:MAG: penicillin acylase family protein [Planctomycetes bacterium]|nr:penicillin acylase family protein [Planctomycetota bacterium]
MRPFLACLLAALGACAVAPTGRSSWTTLRTGSEDLEVYRDDWGIPHVFAKSLHGAFWAEGYIEAQDRLGQLERFRRSAKGDLAELLGESELKSDIERRRNGYSEAELQAMFDASSDRMRASFRAYAAGINAFLREGAMVYDRKPRPWSETDSVAIGVMMSRTFGEAGADHELVIQSVYAQLEKRLGADKASLLLHDILRDHDPFAPTTLNDHDHVPAGPPPKDEKHNFAPVDREWLAEVLREREEVLAHRETIGIPTYGGSNAWVIAPKKSATGRPILYGGPMMGFKTPSICNEIHLVAPGLNVAGMSFPGVPGVMIGFNQRIAWTTTSGGADLVDIYTLDLNPENHGQYRYKDQWLPFEASEVEFKVAGQEPRRETILRSRYGPIVGPIDRKHLRAHVKASSFWMKEHRTFEAVLDFNFAGSLEEFRRSVSKIVTSHNFFVADKDGHIGFWYCGAHPKRRPGHDPRFPQKGDGSMDWEGVLPFEEWPQAVDPPHGFFANWNNKPTRAWEPSGFGKIFWGKKIIDTLESNDTLTFDQAEALARETAYHDYVAEYTVPHILSAARDAKDAEVARAVELLSRYDFVKREGRPEPVIVERWTRAMVAKVFGDEFFPMPITSREVRRFFGDPLLYLLEGNGLVKYDFVGTGDLKAMAVEALQEAVKGGVDALAWQDDRVDFKGKIGRIKSAKGRGTFQMTVEISKDGPRARTLAAPGECESEESAHYADQLPLFERWEYKPFVWRRDEMK